MRHAVGLMVGVALLAVRSAGAQPATSGGTWRLQFPDKAWALLVDLPGFVLDDQWPGRNGTRRMIRAHDADSGVIVSAFLERNPELSSTEQCREVYWAKAIRSPFEKSDVERGMAGAAATVRWLAREFDGRPIRQQNIHAYLFNDGVCAEVHLSKVLYQPDDERLFDAVLRTVRFAATP